MRPAWSRADPSSSWNSGLSKVVVKPRRFTLPLTTIHSPSLQPPVDVPAPEPGRLDLARFVTQICGRTLDAAPERLLLSHAPHLEPGARGVAVRRSRPDPGRCSALGGRRIGEADGRAGRARCGCRAWARPVAGPWPRRSHSSRSGYPGRPGRVSEARPFRGPSSPRRRAPAPTPGPPSATRPR